MILSGPDIIQDIENGNVEIDPFDPSCVNPASVDLHLGCGVAIYKRWYQSTTEADILSGDVHARGTSSYMGPSVAETLDVKDKSHYEVTTGTIGHEGIVLRPGVLYLMHTEERICAKNLVPIIDGKSSIGRLGIFIHVTAGFGDPGFDGQFTLEVMVAHPIRVYAGMRFCQVRFNMMVGANEVDYRKNGHYTGKNAMGPVPSKAFDQFVVEKVMNE